MAMQPLAQQGFSEEEVRRILHAPNREIAFRYELLDGENRTKKAALQGVLSASVANNALAQIKRTARFRIYDGLDDIDYLRDRIRPWVRVRAHLPGEAPDPITIPDDLSQGTLVGVTLTPEGHLTLDI